jgi:hypothetical protein
MLCKASVSRGDLNGGRMSHQVRKSTRTRLRRGPSTDTRSRRTASSELVTGHCQVSKPACIGGVLRYVPVVVRRTIRPPNRTTLTKRRLTSSTRASGLRHGWIPLRGPNRSSGHHQLTHELLPFVRGEFRIADLPEPAAHDEVAAVWCSRVAVRL